MLCNIFAFSYKRVEITSFEWDLCPTKKHYYTLYARDLYLLLLNSVLIPLLSVLFVDVSEKKIPSSKTYIITWQETRLFHIKSWLILLVK